MIKLSRWKVTLCVLAFLFGLVFTLPNLLPASVLASLPKWAPQQRLNLGLDLQGGSYLLLEVDTDALKTEKLTNLTEDVRKTLRDEQIVFSGLNANGGVVSVRITDPAKVPDAFKAVQKLAQQTPTGARDIAITTQPDQRIQMAYSTQGLTQEASKAVDQSIEVIRRRIDQLGTREPTIIRQGVNRIVVQAPGESDPERLKSVIGQTAKLTFQMVDDTVPLPEAMGGHVPPGSQLLKSEDGYDPAVLVKRQVLISGEMLTNAQFAFNPQTGKPVVSFRFNGAGAQRFARATTENVNKRFAIVLDNKVISAPNIREPITGGSGEIEGNFTQQSATDLALLLRSGALPAPLKVQEQRTVGAELGADAVKAGKVSTLIGFAAIVVFMILAYGFLFGGISVLGLIVNSLLIFAAMSVTQATLTLPGVAGLILTLALAVDANVLIYERIRDEERAGRSPLLATETGYQRALVSILDANVTTLIAALIMFQFGSGPVRGFAWTLSVGVLTSVFSAVLVSQVLIGWWFKAAKPKRLPI